MHHSSAIILDTQNAYQRLQQSDAEIQWTR